mgnify:CR=1 FL=1
MGEKINIIRMFALAIVENYKAFINSAQYFTSSPKERIFIEDTGASWMFENLVICCLGMKSLLLLTMKYVTSIIIVSLLLKYKGLILAHTFLFFDVEFLEGGLCSNSISTDKPQSSTI